MKTLAGLYQPDAGQIFIFGQEQVIARRPGLELKIGMVTSTLR